MKKELDNLIKRSLTEIDRVKIKAYAEGDIRTAHKYAMLHLLWSDFRSLIDKGVSFWKPGMLFNSLIYPMLEQATQNYTEYQAIKSLHKKKLKNKIQEKRRKGALEHAQKMSGLHRKEMDNCLKIATYLIKRFPEAHFKMPNIPK